MTQTCDWSRDQSEDDQTREEGRHGDSYGDDEGVSLVSGVGGGTCCRQLIVCHQDDRSQAPLEPATTGGCHTPPIEFRYLDIDTFGEQLGRILPNLSQVF